MSNKQTIKARLEELERHEVLWNKFKKQDSLPLTEQHEMIMLGLKTDHVNAITWLITTLRTELKANAVLEDALRTIRQESDSAWEIGVAMEALEAAAKLRKP